MRALPRWLRRAVILAPLTGIVAQIGAVPAVADPAVPTHYRSTVSEVVDGDGEPVDLDGEVEVNQRLPARWLNDARYGSAEAQIPPSADADAPPE